MDLAPLVTSFIMVGALYMAGKYQERVTWKHRLRELGFNPEDFWKPDAEIVFRGGQKPRS